MRKIRRSTEDAEEYLPYGSFLLFRCVIAAYLKNKKATWPSTNKHMHVQLQ